MTILVTGANGFVGSALCSILRLNDIPFVAATRKGEGDSVAVGDIDGNTSWTGILSDIDAVIHLAGRAHTLGSDTRSAEALFQKTNVEGSVKLAHDAFTAGVRRFVYVSSIAAVGDDVAFGTPPLSESSPCQPTNAYGRSKLEAENRLLDLASTHAADLVVVRPPIVHGNNAPGNMARLARAISIGLPIPLAGVKNARSMIHVDNLAEALLLCATHTKAPGKIFHVKDPEDYSTPYIVKEIARSLNRPARLFYCPDSVLKLTAYGFGKYDIYKKLCTNLLLDDSLIRQELGWIPNRFPLTS